MLGGERLWSVGGGDLPDGWSIIKARARPNRQSSPGIRELYIHSDVILLFGVEEWDVLEEKRSENSLLRLLLKKHGPPSSTVVKLRLMQISIRLPSTEEWNLLN